MHHLAKPAFAIVLSCFCLATAQAQSPSMPPAQNPSGSVNVTPPDGPTGRDLELMVPDGSGGLKELPELVSPDSSTGAVLITPDPQVLPQNEDDTTGLQQIR